MFVLKIWLLPEMLRVILVRVFFHVAWQVRKPRLIANPQFFSSDLYISFVQVFSSETGNP
jgi:hypothetical protein